jgi:anti-sigma regulatory factor (Ser/Thr protein kinase)
VSSPVSTQASASFPAVPTSPAAARRFVTSTLDSWGLEGLAETATLLVSELVTNALLHARSATRLELHRRDGVLHIEVEDTVTRLPTRRHYSPEAGTGRGLALVETLASSWGVTFRADGKAVWFRLPLAEVEVS